MEIASVESECSYYKKAETQVYLGVHTLYFIQKLWGASSSLSGEMVNSLVAGIQGRGSSNTLPAAGTPLWPQHPILVRTEGREPLLQGPEFNHHLVFAEQSCLLV